METRESRAGRIVRACGLAAVLAVAGVRAAEERGGVRIGDGEAEVRALLGEPAGALSMGGRKTWVYPDFSVLIEDGRVTGFMGRTPSIAAAGGGARSDTAGRGAPVLERGGGGRITAQELPALLEVLRTGAGLERAKAADRCVGPEAAPAAALLAALLGDSSAFSVTTYLGGNKIAEGSTTLGQIAADSLGSIGMAAWEPCMERLRQGGAFERADAARALMRLWRNFNASDRSFPALLVEVFRSSVMEEDAPALAAKGRMAGLLEELQTPEGLTALHGALAQPDAGLNRIVTGILGRRREVASVPFLARQFMGHADAEFRERAGEVLAVYSDPAAARAVLGGLERSDAPTRRMIARILGQSKEGFFVPPLLRLLRDRDLEVRREALRSLSRIGSADSILPLIEAAMSDPDDWLAQNAASLLNGLVLDNRDPAVAAALLPGLRHREAARRARLTELAGRTGAPELFEALACTALQDSSAEVRRNAMVYLDRFENPKKKAVFLKCLADERETAVREAALQAVKYGSLRDRQVEILLGIVRGADADRAREAAFLLDELQVLNRQPEALAVLVAALSHGDERVRSQAESLLCRAAGLPPYGPAGRALGADAGKWRAWWRAEGIELPVAESRSAD